MSDRIDIKIDKNTHTRARARAFRVYITLSQCGENRFSYLEPTSVHMHIIKHEKSRKEVVYRM